MSLSPPRQAWGDAKTTRQWQLEASPEREWGGGGDSNDGVKHLMRLALSQAIPQALKSCIQLGVPDILGGGAEASGLTVKELSQEIKNRTSAQTDEEALLLSLRILATEGIVRETSNPDQECVFHLTPTGSLLQTTSNSSLAPMIEYFVDEPIWKAWGAVAAVVAGKEAKCAFEAANDMSSQAFYGNPGNVESLQHANSFVRFISEEEVRACVDFFDWKSLSNKTVVDIGGFSGNVMNAVADAYPLVQCICLDLPEVVRRHSRNECDTRVTLVGGNMFDHKTIPLCNAIFMKHIIQCGDWEEEASIEIMRSCHKALPNDGFVIIAESVLPDPGSTENNLPLYVDYFLQLDGRRRSRTASEWEQFAAATGFQMKAIIHTTVPTCSILVMEKN